MTQRPNFIFIIADDHRARSLGTHGCPEVATPHLDALARRGADFTNAHCQGGYNGAVCVPSRASLMTGRNVAELGTEPQPGGPGTLIRPEWPVFPELLRAAGYHTHGVGKWHNDRPAFNRAFSSGETVFFGGMSDHDAVPIHDYDPEGVYPPEDARTGPEHSTDLFRQSAERFLGTVDDASPFLLYVAFTAPHDPRTPPAAFSIDPSEVSLPPDYLPIHPFDTGEMRVRDERLEAFPRSPEAIRGHLADYYGMIAHLDDAVGRIIEKAREKGLLDNTVIVYTSDHGLAIGSHGLMGKQNLYEHSLNIPLILAGPQIPEGVSSNALVWHGDTRATVLGLAGVKDDRPNCFDLRAHLSGEDAHTRRDYFFAVYRNAQRMVRTERYKLIHYLPDTSGTSDETLPGSDVYQLFDLDRDPYETINLWSVPGLDDVRGQLLAAMADRQTILY